MAEQTIEIKIRPLRVSDRKRLTSLIKKLAEEAGESSLLNAISSNLSSASSSGSSGVGNPKEEEETNPGYIEMGLKLLKMLLDTLEEETHDWFADLIGVKKEKFLELPFDTEMVIVNQLVEAQEASNFFTIASQLYSKIQLLQSKLSGAKGK